MTKRHVPSDPRWARNVALGSVATVLLLMFIGMFTGNPQQSPFWGSPLTMLFFSLCAEAVGAAVLFMRPTEQEGWTEWERGVLKLVGAWFLAFGLFAGTVGVQRFLS